MAHTGANSQGHAGDLVGYQGAGKTKAQKQQHWKLQQAGAATGKGRQGVGDQGGGKQQQLGRQIHRQSWIERERRDDTAKPYEGIFGKMKVLLGMLLAVMVWADAVAAVRMYRYENAQGVKVIDYQVPPEFVGKGYEVLNSQGRVIEVVPRALTQAELAAKSKQDQQKLDQARQAEEDKKLLTIFSSPADAERARDRKLEAIDAYINITKGNILKLKDDFNYTQGQAAERERAGQAVPDFQLEKIESLQRQISQAEEAIQEKEKEKIVIRAEYGKHIERLRELKQLRDASLEEPASP